MDSHAVRSQRHEARRERTRSITYRLPEDLVGEVEAEAAAAGVSHNVMVRQILEKYVQWDRFAGRVGIMPVPKKIVSALGEGMSEADVGRLVDVIRPAIKNIVLFTHGSYDLKRCVETLERYMRVSGMKSDHRVEGPVHHFVIRHELGAGWSAFAERLLRETFGEFLPGTEVRCQSTESTLIASVPLGEDWDEHGP